MKQDKLLRALDDIDQLKNLLKSGAITDKDMTFLFSTVLEKDEDDGNLRFIELLLNYGADPNSLVQYNRTFFTYPLGWIIYNIANSNKNPEYLLKVARLLLNREAEPFLMVHPDNIEYLYSDNPPDSVKESVLDVAMDIYPPLGKLIENNMDYYRDIKIKDHITKTTLSYSKRKQFKQYEIICKDLQNSSNLREIREIAKIYGINVNNKDKATLCSEIATHITIHLTNI
jgi:hypothetical protein